jgi:hypothetical protein
VPFSAIPNYATERQPETECERAISGMDVCPRPGGGRRSSGLARKAVYERHVTRGWISEIWAALRLALLDPEC